MRVFNKNIAVSIVLAVLIFLGAWSCKKDVIENVKPNNVTYNLDTLNLYSSAAQKTRQKSPAQFISILYINLYQQSIPGNLLDNLDVLSSSIGDKNMCNEMIVKSFITGTGVKIPQNTDMRADIDKFISNTYILFYLRKPTEIERYHLKSVIQQDSKMSPTDIYTAFALSKEYQFY